MPVNPYVTVDWIPIQLSVFNSGISPEDIGNWNSKRDGDYDPDDPKFDDANFDYGQLLRFGSLEWFGKQEVIDPFIKLVMGPEDPGPVSNAWGVEPRQNPHVAGVLRQHPPLRLGHSFGTVSADETDNAIPRPWVAWSNSDFANRFELLNVPKSSPARFRVEFSTANVGDSAKRFGHLLDFFNDETRLYRLFDYVDVPSPFLDARKTVSNSGKTSIAGLATPFHHRSRFREPGKFNVNTVQDSRTWSAIGGDQFADWNSVVTSMTGDDAIRMVDRPHPFQSNGQRSLTWFRDSSDDEQRPLFVAKPDAMHGNAFRNSWFYHQGLQKLSNIATTQSNVYGIWLTIGFFELEPNFPKKETGELDFSKPWHVDTDHPEGFRIGGEVGSSIGTISRHRSFCIIDRSIPVAFERGADHNVQDTVRLRRRLE